MPWIIGLAALALLVGIVLDARHETQYDRDLARWLDHLDQDFNTLETPAAESDRTTGAGTHELAR